MAAILLSKGRKAEAEASWRSAVDLNPSYAEAHYNLAVLLSEAGDAAKLAEAATHCDLALAHRAGYVQAHHLMGNIQMSLGEREVASAWYAKAEALAGDGGDPLSRRVRRDRLGGCRRPRRGGAWTGRSGPRGRWGRLLLLGGARRGARELHRRGRRAACC